jgi:hypothetical protein
MGATSDLSEVACDSFAAALGEAGDEDVTEALATVGDMIWFSKMVESKQTETSADKPKE